MRTFNKQLLFLLAIVAVFATGVLVIKAVGNMKVNPILGHDLDLDAKYYGYAANNTIHDITTEDISISAWVKLDSDMSNYSAIVSKLETNVGYWFYLYSNTGQVLVRIFDGTDNYYLTSGTNNIKDNKWHYVAAVIDRDTTLNCKIFIDGVDVSSARTGTIGSIDSITNTIKFDIGALGDTGNYKLDGQIRDVKLYYANNDFWTPAQILYQAQHPFDYSSNAGTLTDYWRLDEGTGTTLYGKVNNLTLSNALAWTTQPKIKMVKQENTTSTTNNPVGWWKFDESMGDSTYLDLDATYYGQAGNNTVHDITTEDISISAWVKVDTDAPSMSQFVGKREVSSGGNWSISYVSTGVLRMNISDGTDVYYVQGNIDIRDNKWHYVAGVIDRSDATQCKIFIDGVENSITKTGTLANVDSLTSTGIFGIGYLLGSAKYDGQIRDVKLYYANGAHWSDAEVLYQAQHPFDVSASAGTMTDYWALNEGTGATLYGKPTTGYNLTGQGANFATLAWGKETDVLPFVYDSSGNGNTGILGPANSAYRPSWSTGKLGRGLSFDGVDDYVNTTAIPYTAGSSFSVSFWAKLGATPPSFGGVVTQASVGIGNTIIRGSGELYWDEGGYGSVQSTRTSWIDYNWHYGTVVYNGSTASLYIDGVFDKQSSAIITQNSGSVVVKIGAFSSTVYLFKGSIDDVRIYNYARSAEQIANDYIIGLKHQEE